MAKPNLTLERLHEAFSYEPDTGLFRWKIVVRKHGGRTQPGDIAGSPTGNGYLELGLDRETFHLHRLAWFYSYGVWPQRIDHINRDRGDNRLSNLREVTNKQNQENRGVRHDSSTGIKGVQPLPSGRWRASIKHNWKQIHIGCYSTIEEAQLARVMKEMELFTHGASAPQVENLARLCLPDETEFGAQ